MEKSIPTIEELQKQIEVEAKKYIEGFAEAGGVEEFVREHFEEGLRSNIMKVLGFKRDRWAHGTSDAWEIDHTNGRESPLIKEIDKRAREIAASLIKEIIEGVTLTPSMIKAVQKEYRYNLSNEISRTAERVASEEAEMRLQEALTTTIKPEQKYLFGPSGEVVGKMEFKQGQWVLLEKETKK